LLAESCSPFFEEEALARIKSGPTFGLMCNQNRSRPRLREALEQRWLRLTRETLPALAAERCWPVDQDHCFQRILLDNAFSGVWYDHVEGRPAYARAPEDALAVAVALGEACVDGTADLAELNRQSLSWRRALNAARSRPWWSS